MVDSGCKLAEYSSLQRLPNHNAELVDAMLVLGQLIQVELEGFDLPEAQLLIDGLASRRGLEISPVAFCVGDVQHRDYERLGGAPLEILCRSRD